MASAGLVKELFLQKFLRQYCQAHCGSTRAAVAYSPGHEQHQDHEPAFILLTQRYGIRCSRHGQFPNLVSFKYSQHSSPFAEPIVRECRGIILDESKHWNIVAYPFQKFFNCDEALASSTAPDGIAVDWNTSSVLEKMDGTLCIVYNYRDGWHVATTGSADAGGAVQHARPERNRLKHVDPEVHQHPQAQVKVTEEKAGDVKPIGALDADKDADEDGDVTGTTVDFASLFWRTFQTQGCRLPGGVAPRRAVDNMQEETETKRHERRVGVGVEDRNDVTNLHEYTLLFELCTPENRIVVQYEEAQVWLLGSRHRGSWKELTAEDTVSLFDSCAWSDSDVGINDSSPLGDSTVEAAAEADATVDQGVRCHFAPVPRITGLNSKQAVERHLQTLDPFRHEGCVVVDHQFRRVKIKHPGYVALHHLENGNNVRNILQVVRTGECSEFMSYFPHMKDDIQSVMRPYEQLRASLEALWRQTQEQEPQQQAQAQSHKRFQVVAMSSALPEALLAVRAGTVSSVTEYLATMDLQTLLKALGIADVKARRRKTTRTQKKKEKEKTRQQQMQQRGKEEEQEEEEEEQAHKKPSGRRAEKAAAAGPKRKQKQKHRTGRARKGKRGGRSSARAVSDEDEDDSKEEEEEEEEETQRTTATGSGRVHNKQTDTPVVLPSPLRCFRHGSLTSTDRDVVYLFAQRPDPKQCAAFVAAGNACGEDRNLVVLSDGMVSWCYKGDVAETNNALMHTYPLHEENHVHGDLPPCPITRRANIDVVLRVCKAVVSCLGMSVHELAVTTPKNQALRKSVKAALRSGHFAVRLNTLCSLPFHSHELALHKALGASTLKSIAFQLAIAVAVIQDKEVYTKEQAWSLVPGLKSILQRQPLASAADLLPLTDTCRMLKQLLARVSVTVKKGSSVNSFSVQTATATAAGGGGGGGATTKQPQNMNDWNSFERACMGRACDLSHL